MLSDSPIFSVLPAADLARAKAFYTQTLGLSVQFESEAGVGFTAGSGAMLFIYPYGQTKAEHTTAGFMVADVESVVAELRAKGLKFEEYDLPGLTFEPLPDARKFEFGTRDWGLYAGLAEGIRFANQAGIEDIEARNLALAARMKGRLADIPGLIEGASDPRSDGRAVGV